MTEPLLAGFTVLDFTRVLAGPYCTRLLADLGARVIKVERPGDGDEMRRNHLQIEPGREDQSTYFIRLNAGKLSVAIDLGHADGRAVVLDLVREADVVVENFVPGVMGRLGLDYRSLAAIRPDLVYCSISGYGQTGPLRDRPAFAHIINAVSGAMDLDRQGDPAPRVSYLQTADALAAAHAFGAILAALLRRGRTGDGACIDLSMLQSLWPADDIAMGSVLNGGASLAGPRAGMIVHAVRGRYLALQTVGAVQLWPRLLEVMRRPDLAADPRFATPLARREHWTELRAVIVAWLDGFASAEAALDALTAARIPCAPVLSPEEVVSHPHSIERRAFATVPHPARGEVRITSVPFHLDGAAIAPAGPAPYRVGEHTRTVLRDVLGYSEERVDQLQKAGAITVV